MATAEQLNTQAQTSLLVIIRLAQSRHSAAELIKRTPTAPSVI
jgi:hypothetical protein